MDDASEFPKGAGILVVDEAERFFKCRLQDELEKKKITKQEIVLCTDYVAEILNGFIRSFPSNFYAADYLFAHYEQAGIVESEEPIRQEECLVRGGQTCFVICVLFPGYHQRGLGESNQKYFAQMGTTFFYRYYTKTGALIPRYMAENFNRLVPLTREAIKG